jgi:hypothetical protein
MDNGPRTADYGLLLLGGLLLAAAFAGAFGPDRTRATARVVVAEYAVACALMLLLRPGEWASAAGRGRLVRGLWLLGAASFWVHVATAYGEYHHWSHAAAVEHTREVSGVGEGIYVSYLFGLAWTADALCWWARPARYAARPAWVGWVVHGFLAFIVFDGTAVYEGGPIRWAGVAIFGVLAALLVRRWTAPVTEATTASPRSDR